MKLTASWTKGRDASVDKPDSITWEDGRRGILGCPPRWPAKQPLLPANKLLRPVAENAKNSADQSPLELDRCTYRYDKATRSEPHLSGTPDRTKRR